MKLFRTHFSVLFSLFVLLCSFQLVVFIGKVIKSYEAHLADDYSIVVVSSDVLDTDLLMSKNSIIKSIEELDSSSVLDRLKNDVTVANMDLLRQSMPKFYTLKLDRFPSQSVANSLKNSLLQNASIKRVEIFAKTYDKIYRVLKLLNLIVAVFVAFASITSLLLIVKQMRLWTYEHQERMYVMNLFGASFWQKSSPLYKSALLDSILSAILAAGVFFALDKIPFLKGVFAELSISAPDFVIYKDGAILLFIALVISLISTTLAMTKVKQV